MTQQSAHFGGVAHPGGGYDPQIWTQPRFLCNALNPQVSSSYVYSLGSYCVETQIYKHIHKQRDAVENIQRSSLRYDVGQQVTTRVLLKHICCLW